MIDTALIAKHPPRSITSRLIWTAVVNVAERKDLGTSPNGERFIVPILGGNFYAGPELEGLAGKVLPGGADRQLVRADGVKELDALYEMQTNCGVTITIRNRVIIDDAVQPERYAMSTIKAIAPQGRFDWLNRRLLIGTLQTAQPDRQAVIVRAWEAGIA